MLTWFEIKTHLHSQNIWVRHVIRSLKVIFITLAIPMNLDSQYLNVIPSKNWIPHKRDIYKINQYKKYSVKQSVKSIVKYEIVVSVAFSKHLITLISFETSSFFAEST